MKNSTSLLYGFLLLVGDFFALMGAFGLAFVIRVRFDERPLVEPITAEAYISVIAVLLAFWLLIFGLLGMYRSDVYENRFNEAGRIAIGSVVGILFLIGAEYVLDRPIFPARLVMLYGLGISFLCVLLFRTLARVIKRQLHSYGIGLNRVLLVGSTDITKELIESLNHPHSGFLVVGVVGDLRSKYELLDRKKQFANFSEAVNRLNNTQVHSIVQTELYPEQDKNDEIMTYAQEQHIAYRFVPGNSRLFVGKIDVNLFQNIPVVAVHQTALVGWGRVVKRLFDVLVGILLLVLFSPIMLLTWLVLSVFGGGNAVYRQTRMSRFQTEIGLYKFRTHKNTYNGLTPEEAFEKMGKPELAETYRANGDFLEDDPRIGKLGRFLRKTSIDELPQLFNIIAGSISLVGPRPLIPQEINQFNKKSMILSVKPGLTGLAVVSGRRDIPYEERRRLDMYYVQNWSFWLDLVILSKTVVQVVKRAFSGKSD